MFNFLRGHFMPFVTNSTTTRILLSGIRKLMICVSIFFFPVYSFHKKYKFVIDFLHVWICKLYTYCNICIMYVHRNWGVKTVWKEIYDTDTNPIKTWNEISKFQSIEKTVDLMYNYLSLHTYICLCYIVEKVLNEIKSSSLPAIFDLK